MSAPERRNSSLKYLLTLDSSVGMMRSGNVLSAIWNSDAKTIA